MSDSRRPPLSPSSIPRLLSEATAALQRNEYADAHDLLVTILKRYPDEPQPCYLMGMVMIQSNELDKACYFFERAQKKAPNNVQVLNGYASALQMQGKLDVALNVYKRAIKLNPSYGSAYNNCAVIHKKQGQLVEAESCYQKAVASSKDFGDALNNLGFVQQEQGKISAACESFWKAHESGQCQANAYSNYLMALNYDAALSAADLMRAHCDWGQQLVSAEGFGADKRKQSPLRIAYLSADFRMHSVAFFIESIIACHDRERYQIYCYYNNVKVDSCTERLKRKADHWLDCVGLSDEALAQRITTDKIDILIDLSGHTGLNRLNMMRLRPAPMQVTWLGYPAATGLPQMDYRISDGLADPLRLASSGHQTKEKPDAHSGFVDSLQTDELSAEKLIRLPGAFLCYQGDDSVPLQRGSRKKITFASFNNFSKINECVIGVWGALLTRIPGSILLVKNSQLQCAKTRALFIKRFADLGVSPNRIECMGYVASQSEHLELYNRVDIALDTFPYNGTTTTFEALWMGVPVVTFAGDRHAARVGASILTELGLPELVGENSDDYIHIAEALANDSHRRLELHESLRKRLQHSSLCDGPAFTHKLELALERAWQELGN